MELPVPVRRLAYRVAYVGLRAYWFVAHPTTRGVKCLLTDGELVLLVRHTYGRRDWDLPGGSRRRGEEPLMTARREMGEELGVAIDEWTDLGELLIDDFHRHDRVQYMRAEVKSPRLVLDKGELATAKWFSRRELPPELGRYARAIIATLPEVESAAGSVPAEAPELELRPSQESEHDPEGERHDVKQESQDHPEHIEDR